MKDEISYKYNKLAKILLKFIEEIEEVLKNWFQILDIYSTFWPGTAPFIKIFILINLKYLNLNL